MKRKDFCITRHLHLTTAIFDDIIEAGAVLVDVASGSVQVSHYEQSKLQFSQNLPMGSLRVLENLSTVKNSTISFSSVLEDFIKAGINNYKMYSTKIQTISIS